MWKRVVKSVSYVWLQPLPCCQTKMATLNQRHAMIMDGRLRVSMSKVQFHSQKGPIYTIWWCCGRYSTTKTIDLSQQIVMTGVPTYCYSLSAHILSLHNSFSFFLFFTFSWLEMICPQGPLLLLPSGLFMSRMKTPRQTWKNYVKWSFCDLWSFSDVLE